MLLFYTRVSYQGVSSHAVLSLHLPPQHVTPSYYVLDFSQRSPGALTDMGDSALYSVEACAFTTRTHFSSPQNSFQIPATPSVTRIFLLFLIRFQLPKTFIELQYVESSSMHTFRAFPGFFFPVFTFSALTTAWILTPYSFFYVIPLNSSLSLKKTLPFEFSGMTELMLAGRCSLKYP